MIKKVMLKNKLHRVPRRLKMPKKNLHKLNKTREILKRLSTLHSKTDKTFKNKLKDCRINREKQLKVLSQVIDEITLLIKKKDD